MNRDDATTFEAFFVEVEAGLRGALVAKYGADPGRDAVAEALSYAWQHWDRLQTLENPGGYLYRVGDRWARRQRSPRRQITMVRPQPLAIPEIEPGLDEALAALPMRQRQAVVLIAGFGLSQSEAAALLGVKRSSVQNHVERGLARLRTELGVQL